MKEARLTAIIKLLGRAGRDGPLMVALKKQATFRSWGGQKQGPTDAEARRQALILDQWYRNAVDDSLGAARYGNWKPYDPTRYGSIPVRGPGGVAVICSDCGANTMLATSLRPHSCERFRAASAESLDIAA